MKRLRHFDKLKAGEMPVAKWEQFIFQANQQQRGHKLGHVRHEIQRAIRQNHFIQVGLERDGLL